MPSTWAQAAAAVLLFTGFTFQVADANAVSTALGAIREAYTTNAICQKKSCINPVFPGMEDLHRLQQSKWITSTLQKAAPHMGFCRNAITYDPALPMPAGDGTSVKQLVQRQDNAASTMFYYHVTGLGMEAWDYQKPEFASDCVKSIWRMTCFTYFPRAEVGSQDGAISSYIRPCKSSCQNYIAQCNVECCDESVQCVFSHTKAISASQTVTTEGYIPHDGPSSLCTGAAGRSAQPLSAAFWAFLMFKALFSFDGDSVGGVRSLFAGVRGRKVFLIGCLAIVALSLQGCDYDVPVHNVGNWRAEPDYLMKNSFMLPGGSAKTAMINSCSLERLSQTLQCSGRGVCKMWDAKNLDNTLSFCDCDRDWADAECRTQRKSQAVAYLLSLFLGMFGADQFYLGFHLAGVLKLFTLGGGGVWWVVDIIRIGSAPVPASNYRVAADLPHYAFVLSCVMFSLFLGFVIAYFATTINRSRKRKDALLLQNNEENRQLEAKPFGDAYQMKDPRSAAKGPIIQGGSNYGGTSINGFPV